MSGWIFRIAAVISLLGAAAAIATPKGRIPLAMRALARTLGRKPETGDAVVSPARRMLAFIFVVIAVLIALI